MGRENPLLVTPTPGRVETIGIPLGRGFWTEALIVTVAVLFLSFAFCRSAEAQWVSATSGWVRADLAASSTSPLTTKGDIHGYSTTDARLPVGANDLCLVADSTQPLGLKWAAGVPVLNTVGPIDLVAGAATKVFGITLSTGSVASAIIYYEVEAGDAANERTVVIGEYRVVGAKTAGSFTATGGIVTAALTTGTAGVGACTPSVQGNDPSIDFTLSCTSTLTETYLRARVLIRSVVPLVLN